jgi:hypothetical protein
MNESVKISPTRFSEISPAWRDLVRLCQSINHGQIESLQIANGEPSFNPAPRVFFDVKLDNEEGPRPEVALPDFELCSELHRLMRRIDNIKQGRVARLEIRGGIPRRAVFESLVG